MIESEQHKIEESEIYLEAVILERKAKRQRTKLVAVTQLSSSANKAKTWAVDVADDRPAAGVAPSGNDRKQDSLRGGGVFHSRENGRAYRSSRIGECSQCVLVSNSLRICDKCP